MLSDQDKRHLEALEKKFDVVKDRVRGVVNYYSTGLWLHGNGGLGKSYTVLNELKRLKANYIPQNSRLTGRILFDKLMTYPDAVHVLEDCGTLLDDRNGLGVLRSALWSQSDACPSEREVCWGAKGADRQFMFYGGIILVCNRAPDDIPEIAAVKTRITNVRLEASNSELGALMRKLALAGYQYGTNTMTPQECRTVAEFIIDEHKSINRNLDMRLLVNGYRDYLQWRARLSANSWEELVLTRMRETTTIPKGRKARTTNESQIAEELEALTLPYQEKIRQWEERTGHTGERSYYRALKRVA